ncbi:MAG: hypothetical protein ACXWUG_29675 [Polyangiales bacterium]
MASLSSLAFAVALTILADKVATTTARGTSPLAERAAMRTTTEVAAKGLGHVTIAEAEVVQGEGAAGDKIGTSAGLVAVGKVTGADWVIVPIVNGNRLEIQACQVSTGRVESLVREIDPKVDPAVQVREMLALLLRPQGVADDPLPWDQKKPAPSASASTSTAPSSSAKPPPPPKAPPPRYDEGGSVALGAGGGITDVVARPKEATGKRLGFTWNTTLLVAVPGRRWLEILGRFSGVHGPGDALVGEVGARATYAASRFALGGELTLGAFGQLGGAQTAQFTLGVSPVVAMAITRRIVLDLRPASFRVATGSGTVALLGADLSLLFRF